MQQWLITCQCYWSFVGHLRALPHILVTQAEGTASLWSVAGSKALGRGSGKASVTYSFCLDMKHVTCAHIFWPKQVIGRCVTSKRRDGGKHSLSVAWKERGKRIFEDLPNTRVTEIKQTIPFLLWGGLRGRGIRTPWVAPIHGDLSC